MWTHPPGNRREKTLIATLKKGQSFGEMAILNDEPRAEVRARGARRSEGEGEEGGRGGGE